MPAEVVTLVTIDLATTAEALHISHESAVRLSAAVRALGLHAGRCRALLAIPRLYIVLQVAPRRHRAMVALPWEVIPSHGRGVVVEDVVAMPAEDGVGALDVELPNGLPSC